MTRIKLESVTKKFTRKVKKENTLFLSHLVNFLSGKKDDFEFEAVKDASFSAEAGEIWGLIGKNGSGKSTLLKLIAGIYSADSGIIKTEGNLVYTAGFGQGLKTKLTMEENIYLMGAIMGLDTKEVKGKIDKIAEFSGLEDYLNTPVFQFSSGMVSRLNFSISVHCLEHRNPDILLLDEVFSAGGDIDFQEKGVKKMEELIKRGATVVLASHTLDMVQKYCHKAILLQEGKIIFAGSSEDAIKRYLQNAGGKK